MSPVRPRGHARVGRFIDRLSAPSRNHVARVLASAALVGFCFGAFIGSRTLYSVEIAQVAAGVVSFPPEHPTFIHDVRASGLLSIQLPAWLLRGGMSEPQVCVLLSGVESALAAASVAAWALLVSGNALLSLLAPILFLGLKFSGHQYPTVYPVGWADVGNLGFSATLMALALVGLKRGPAAAFMLGLLPGIHPFWAVPAWLVAAVLLLFGPRDCFVPARRSAVALLLGLLVCAAGHAVHPVRLPAPVYQESPSSPRMLEAFMNSWDGHRSPIHFGADPSRVPRFFEADLYFVLLSLAFLAAGRGRIPAAVRGLLAALVGFEVFVIAYLIVADVGVQYVPLTLRTFIIPRWLNLNAILLPTLIVGALGRLAFRKGSPVAALSLGALLLLVASGIVRTVTIFNPAWNGLRRPTPLWTWNGVAFPLATLAAVVLIRWEPRLLERPAWPRRSLTLLLLGLGVCSVSLLAVRAVERYRLLSPEDLEYFPGERRVLLSARDGSGFLITEPHVTLLPQLTTRRPVLLDDMTILPYAPGGVPAMERILNEVYFTSLLSPLGFHRLRDTWQDLPPEKWAELGRRFHATQVLVRTTWRLRLPIVAQSKLLTLYQIPE